MAARKRAAAQQHVDELEDHDEHETPASLIAQQNGQAAHASPFDEPDDETSADRVARMLDSSREDDRAVVKLFRLLGPMKYGWCNDYSVIDFERGGFALIREQFGPGEYQIRLYGVRPGTNYFGVRARENISIIADSTSSSSSAAPAQQVPSDIARMLDTLAQTQRELLGALTKQQAPASPASDPVKQLETMLQMMALMRSAMGTDSPARSSISDIVAAMREMREVAGELNPSSDPLAAALPGVIDLVRTAQQQRAGVLPNGAGAGAFPAVSLPPMIAAPSSTVAPAPVPPSSSSSSEPAPAGELAGEQLAAVMMRARLAVLLDMAGKPDTIDQAAEFAYEHAPDELLDMVSYPGWIDLLAQFEPRCAAHKDWLGLVGARLLEVIAEESSDAGPPPPS